MRTGSTTLTFATWVAVGCGGARPDPADPPTSSPATTLAADDDGDGLTNGEEAELGSDPTSADTDGDGLGDAEERELGTDLQDPDTDDDEYTDRDEVFEGKDPTDPHSVIYRGGYPYYFDKDTLEPGPDLAEKGGRFTRLQLKDQFGDVVDLWDLYNDERPVVIDISAMWCQPCTGLALYLEGLPDPWGYAEMWPSGPEVVARGDVLWVTVVGQDALHEPAGKPDVSDWYEAFPLDGVPILADGEQIAPTYVGLTEWPTVLLLEPDLTVSPDVDEWWAEFVLPELARRYPE